MAEETRKEGVVFLRGKKVILRPVDKTTDLETCAKGINDPEVRQFLLTRVPMTRKMEEEWFEKIGRGNAEIILAIEVDGNYIGNIALVRIDWMSGTAFTGTVIFDKRYWGKGFGTDAKMVLLNYAFNTLGLRKICSSVYSFNERSLRYSLGCGYKEEGRLKAQHLRQRLVNGVPRAGEYYDEIILAVFKEDFEPVWEKYIKERRAEGTLE